MALQAAPIREYAEWFWTSRRMADAMFPLTTLLAYEFEVESARHECPGSAAITRSGH